MSNDYEAESSNARDHEIKEEEERDNVESAMSEEEDEEDPEVKSPRKYESWVDLFSDDEEQPVITVDERKKLNSNEVVKLHLEQPCCGYVRKDSKVENAMCLAELIPTYTNVHCAINSLRNYVNYCIHKNDSEELDEGLSMNLLDSYMRLRHDTMASFMIRCVGQSFVKTDVHFNEIFDIDSKRTPDFILTTKNGYIILEVAAVSNPERAYKKKGHERFGYTPKYSKEITMLKAKGVVVDYVVIVFDMSDLTNQDYLTDMQAISSLLNSELAKEGLFDLEYLRKEYITTTEVMLNLFSVYLNPLYGTSYELALESDLEDLRIFGPPIKKFLGKYKRVGISNNVYDRVSSICPKLDYMLSKIDKDEKKKRKYLLVFEQLNNNFKFIFDNRGAHASDWYNNINNNSIAWICDHMRMHLKGVEVKSPRADFEFMSYERASGAIERTQENLYEYLVGHNRIEVTEEKELSDFSRKIRMLKTLSLECKYEDEDLESKIIKSINDCDKSFGNEINFTDHLKKLSFKPLCAYTVGNEAFYAAVKNYKEQLLKKNTPGDDVSIIYHAKQPFIFPLCQVSQGDYISYTQKPDILQLLVNLDLGPYTNMIIKIASMESFKFGTTQNEINQKYEKCKMDLSKYHKMVIGELKELYKNNNLKDFPTMQCLPNYDTHRQKLQDLNKILHKTATENGIENKNIGVITMSKGQNSEATNSFKKEMEHFRDKKSKSHYKGVGMQFDPKTLNHLFYNLKESLLAPSEEFCPDPLYDGFVAEDANLLKQLKTDIIRKNAPFYDSLRKTNFYHSAAFISRLCHTLMFHSQSSLNSTKIVVDNLGYRNVLLIIKGGKKIFSTKKSKLFRLMYPTYSPLDKIFCPTTLPSSFRTILSSGRTFVLTPWMNYHETIVADGITFLHRLMGFAVLSKVENLNFLQNMDRIYLNLILAVHNRRQTETMLHNLRYISMNCMSEASAIEEILPEMAEFNYDFFQCWLRQQLSDHFLEFAQGLKKLHDTSRNSKIVDFQKIKLKNIFNRNSIEDVNTLALSIYSSYLMSKAPTTQSLEQVKNMKSIMKTHDEFMESKGGVEQCFVGMGDEGFLKYSEKLNKSDFNLDPSYCFLLGKFMGDYLGTLEKKSKLIQKWDSVLDSPWDEMANTKGLRGDDDDFFGNKGYYIVYKEVLESKKCSELMDILKSDIDPHDKEKSVRELNETFRFRIKNKPLEKVVFHVVDKVQRGGSREIYVMDKETKVHQQVIEDYTKYLCKLVPNEMISIPSNKRLQHIHSKVFEGGKEFNEKYYWVLDCRKWAPKSIVEKFIIFLMGARHALPESFVIHSLNFFNMMLKKRIYTRPHVVEILTKSIAGEKFKNYFKIDDRKKAYYFDMPYSWVMGIFNYFSSLMHVATQLHAAHVIRISTHRGYGVDNLLHMVAHSDDSAGKIMVNNKHQMLRASFIYEVLMHASNHLLSKKKCNQGKVYYEFISILYIGGSLLSLLSKFTGMFNYHPTDKGYCNDITDAYSKSTELLLNGATFEQSYLAMKIQTQLIYRFYFGKDIAENYYNMPPSLFGVPDSHPLMALMCGSDADTFRIFKSCSEDHRRLICSIDKNLLPLTTERTGLIKAFQCVPRVSPNRKLQLMQNSLELSEDFKNSWTFKNVKFKNTHLNAIQFVNKLKDKTFLAALQDETLTRRLSRSYFFRSHLTVKTAYGDMHPKEIREIIFLMDRTIKKNYEGLKESVVSILKDVENDDVFKDSSKQTLNNLFDFLYCEVSKLHDYFQKIFYREEDVVENKKTTKPVYITLQKTAEECPVDYNPQSLCSWLKEPNLRHLLPDTRGFNTAENFVVKTLRQFSIELEELNIEQLFPIMQKIKQRSRSEYFCYSNLPSDLREISTYQDVLNFLSHNTFQNKMITGISVQFGKTITAPMEHMNKALDDVDLQYTISLCVLSNAIINSKDFREEMLNVEFEAPEFLKNAESKMKLLNLVTDCMNFWDKRQSTNKFTKSLFCLTKQLLLGNKSFDADLISGCFFNSFVKRQLLIDNVWLGVGKLFIALGNIKILFIIQNIRVIKVLVQVHDYYLDVDQICYINMCLFDSQLPKLQENMVNTSVEDWGTLGICYNINGDYSIGDVRGSLRHIPAQLDTNLTTPLSNLEKGRIKSFKGSKMIWEAYVEENKTSYQLNTLPIEIQNSVSLLKGKMLDNLNNKRLLSEDLDCVSYLIEICAKELDLERFVEVENVVKNYHLTDTFKVMKKCHTLSLCKVIDPEVKLTNYPASEGGLLNMFISYANFDHTFDFKWHRAVSPEYMMLKSAQPGAFMTELAGSIKEKFDSLYTKEDKDMIHKSLMNLAKGFIENKEEQLLNLLCTWGYAGVAGALEEISSETTVKSFEKIRLYPLDSPYFSLFENLYVDLLYSLFGSYKLGLTLNDFIRIESLDDTFRINDRNLNYYLMSVLHSTILEEYQSKSMDKWVYNPHYHLISLMLTCILENRQTSEDFKLRISNNTILKSLPVSKNTHKEWQIALNTCRMLYVNKNAKNMELDYHIRRDLSTELINPYVITRDLMLTQGVKIEATRLFHYGGVSNHLYDILVKDFVEEFKGIKLFFKMKKIDLKELLEADEFYYNSEWFPRKMLTSEFLEGDEYDEIKMELQSSEPDISYIETLLSDYKENEELSPFQNVKRNMVKVVSGGKLMNVLKYELNFIMLFGGNLSMDVYNHLRMIGEDILILTDRVPLRLLNSENIKVFRSKNTAWHGHCMINPELLYYIVISNNLDDVDFWSRVLESDFVEKSKFSSVRTSSYFDYRNEKGNVINIDKLVDKDGLWDIIAADMRVDEEEAERKRLEREKPQSIALDEIDKMAKKLENEGLDPEQIIKYKEDSADPEKKASWDDLFGAFTKMDNEKKEASLQGGMKEAIDEVIKKPKSSQQHEMIMQVPKIFGGGRERGASIRNNLFREKKIIAEIESMCPGLVWKVLSGSLYISQLTFEMFKNQLSMYQTLVKGSASHKKGKQFLINLCKLILNDAKVVPNPDDDIEIWRSVTSITLRLMLLDENEGEGETTFIDEDVDIGSLKYGVSGVRKTFH